MMERIRTLPGSYGSAGDGARVLRHTATAAGVGTTATVIGLKPMALPVRLDRPTDEELWSAIEAQQCCFCNDLRTFKSLSLHWVSGHGIDLQDIRDQLQLPKGYGFVSEATRQKNSEHGKRMYDPMRLRQKGGQRVLTEYGRRIQREKLQAMGDTEYREKVRLQAQLANTARGERIKREYEHANPCVICGAIFERITYHATTCSKACNETRRKRRARIGPRPERQLKKSCAYCGIVFQGRGSTDYCSLECGRQGASVAARNRTDHRAVMMEAKKAADDERRRLRRPSYCSVLECPAIVKAKGFCGRHYQQARA